jgi:hypothetical protein
LWNKSAFIHNALLATLVVLNLVKHWIILTTVCVSIILKQTSHFAITFEEIQLANSYPVFPHPATNQLNKNQEIITKNIIQLQTN